MVHLSDVHQSNAALGTQTSSIVAIFAGGTSGIGESTLKALAAHAQDPKVYLIGRNEGRAATIIGDCTRMCPGGSFAFVKAALSLLKNVDRVCAEIEQKEQE